PFGLEVGSIIPVLIDEPALLRRLHQRLLAHTDSEGRKKGVNGRGLLAWETVPCHIEHCNVRDRAVGGVTGFRGIRITIVRTKIGSMYPQGNIIDIVHAVGQVIGLMPIGLKRRGRRRAGCESVRAGAKALMPTIISWSTIRVVL